MKLELIRLEDKVYFRVTSENHEEGQQIRLFANQYINDPQAPRYEENYLYLEVKGVDTVAALPAPGDISSLVADCPNCRAVLSITLKDGKVYAERLDHDEDKPQLSGQDNATNEDKAPNGDKSTD